MLIMLQKKIDNLMTAISAMLIAAMFAVIIVNVVLRLIPSIGGFKWYMEFSQYANVWAMLLGASGIAAMGTNLRVEAVDALILEKIPGGLKIGRLIVDISELVFYATMTYSGWLLATKAKQKVSTMPQFTMGQVYMIFPIAGILCILAVLIHMAVTLSAEQEEKKEE